MKHDTPPTAYSPLYVHDLLAQITQQRQGVAQAEQREAAARRQTRQAEARLSDVETENRELRATNGMLRATVRRLEDERRVLERRLALTETQLAEAHRAAVAADVRALEAGQAQKAAEEALAVAQAQLVSAGVQTAGPPATPPDWVKPNVPAATGEPHRRKPRPKAQDGHRGYMPPTAIKDVRLDACPCCGAPLPPGVLASIHQILNIVPPPEAEVLEVRTFKAWCSACQKWRQPEADMGDLAVGQSRIGIGLAAFVVYLRITMRLPVRKVQACLRAVWRIDLSPGEICGIVNRVARSLKPAAEALLTEARGSPVVQMDETGWRENGRNGYIWLVATVTGIRYYAYRHSRAAAVVTELLGKDFAGILVSDFYGAYNRVGRRRQRCWVHLLRDLHALAQAHPEHVSVQRWVRCVYRLLYQAACQAKAAGQGSAAYAGLVARAQQLGGLFAGREGHPCRVLAQRLLDYQDELFVFVEEADVPPDNNLSERAVRALVVVRKISGGSRSVTGTESRMILSSLFETWTARKLDVLEHCMKALAAAPRFQRATPAATAA